MNSQLTRVVAEQHRSDMLAAAARSRRTAGASQNTGALGPGRVWRHLRRRPAVA